MSARAESDGWRATHPPSGSKLDQLTSFMAKPLRDLGLDYASHVFTRGDDAALFLVISRISGPSIERIECRIIAPDAAAAPDGDLVATWANRPPTRSIDQFGARIWQWEPGLRDGHLSTGVVFVPESSPLRAQLPLFGLAIAAMGNID